MKPTHDDHRPSFATRLVLLMAMLAAPPLLATLVVYPVRGAVAAVTFGFAFGIPSVLFAATRIGFHGWLDE